MRPIALPVTLVLLATTAGVLDGRHAAGDAEGTARAFLVASYGLTGAELDRVGQGQVVSRTLPARHPREIGTLGVARVRVAPERYVERLADIARFKSLDEAVLQIGVFQQPPTLADVSALTLDEGDLRDLRDCRVGDCGVQLSAAAIDRFRRELDWRGAGVQADANRLMRQILVEYVARYQEEGAAAAMHYADRPSPLDLGREFTSLAESAPDGWAHFPALRRHLFEYPAPSAPGTSDVLYWSKEIVGRRTVTSVTHLAIARTADDSPAAYAIASKHIYGSHYFDASLGLTILIPDGSAPAGGTYLVYVNRSRIDILGGVLGGVKRKIVGSRARSTVSDTLARLQRTLERDPSGPSTQ
jgi:hypothetical protein